MILTGRVLTRGLVTGLSADLGGEDIARICIDCKADIIMVQNEQILKKVILVLIYLVLGQPACSTRSYHFRFC